MDREKGDIKSWLDILKLIPTIHNITISWFTLSCDDFFHFLEFFSSHRLSLCSLRFKNCLFPDEIQKSFERFRDKVSLTNPLENIRIFELTNCSINDFSLSKIISYLSNELLVLYLMSIQWKGEFVQLPDEILRKFEGLQELYLNEMGLKNDSPILSILQVFKELNHLSVVCNDLTNFPFEELSKLKSLEILEVPFLFILNFDGCPSIPKSIKLINVHDNPNNSLCNCSFFRDYNGLIGFGPIEYPLLDFFCYNI